MLPIKKIMLPILLITPTLNGMLRVSNTTLRQRLTKALQDRQVAIIKRVIHAVEQDPHFIKANWPQTRSLILNAALRIPGYNILNPNHVPPAIDTARVTLHHMAPAHLKEHYLLKESCLTCQECDLPYGCCTGMQEKVPDHHTKIYDRVLSLGDWRKDNPHYSRKAPGLPDDLNHAMVEKAAQAMCKKDCHACKLAKSDINQAFREFKRALEIDNYRFKAAADKDQPSLVSAQKQSLNLKAQGFATCCQAGLID